jgi:hypothetical protein
MEEILKEILKELQWHTRQNDKIIELLAKQRRPCGEQRVPSAASLSKIFDALPDEVMKDPRIGPLLKAVREVEQHGK